MSYDPEIRGIDLRDASLVLHLSGRVTLTTGRGIADLDDKHIQELSLLAEEAKAIREDAR